MGYRIELPMVGTDSIIINSSHSWYAVTPDEVYTSPRANVTITLTFIKAH
jgi:hypothetical protein